MVDNPEALMVHEIEENKDYAVLISTNAGALAKIMNGEVLTGEDANYEDIREIMGEFRFLHFATHGKANDMKGDFSYIAFRKKSDPKECALLYVREIYNLPLKAELVVLSACETGIGEAQTGEGLISIARAFTYSGAKSVLTTLWPVNDEKTKEIMLYFYENLKAGLPKDTAIQKAKLSLLDKNKSTQSHPFYWAGYLPFGDMRPLEGITLQTACSRTQSGIWICLPN